VVHLQAEVIGCFETLVILSRLQGITVQKTAIDIFTTSLELPYVSNGVVIVIFKLTPGPIFLCVDWTFSK
jgi:hypothetical protein